MGSNQTEQTTETAEYEQRFPNWVYQIPGILLMAGGLAAIVFMTFA